MTDTTHDPIHPVLQFLILVGITVGLMVAGAFVGLAISGLTMGMDTIMGFFRDGMAPRYVNLIWIIQVTSTTLPLFLGPFIFAKYIVKQPQTYLKASNAVNPLLFVIVLGVMLFSMPFMELLISINQKMVLPHFLKSVEDWMRRSEAEAARETGILLKLKTVWDMLRALLIVGLLTAIAEEFFFRGCIQTIFTRWTNNKHWGIWIAAILFSAIHMEFFGFLPRLLLGVFFGYFVTWSGSVWTSVWGHFINNGTAVVMTWLYQQKKIKVNPDDLHVSVYLYAASFVLTLFLLTAYRYTAMGEKKAIV